MRSARAVAADRHQDRAQRRERGEEAAGDLRLAVRAFGMRLPLAERDAVRDVAMLISEGLRELGLVSHRCSLPLTAPADRFGYPLLGGRETAHFTAQCGLNTAGDLRIGANARILEVGRRSPYARERTRDSRRPATAAVAACVRMRRDAARARARAYVCGCGGQQRVRPLSQTRLRLHAARCRSLPCRGRHRRGGKRALDLGAEWLRAI